MAKINTVEAFVKASKIISETKNPAILQKLNSILYRSLNSSETQDNTEYIYLTREEKKIFSTRTYSPKVEITQPIYKETVGNLREYYDHDYIRENSYEDGVGKIFVSRGDGFAPLERDASVSFTTPEPKPKFGYIEVVRPIIQLQMELTLSKTRNLRNLSLKQKRDEAKGKKLIIDSLQETMKQYQY